MELHVLFLVNLFEHATSALDVWKDWGRGFSCSATLKALTVDTIISPKVETFGVQLLLFTQSECMSLLVYESACPKAPKSSQTYWTHNQFTLCVGLGWINVLDEKYLDVHAFYVIVYSTKTLGCATSAAQIITGINGMYSLQTALIPNVGLSAAEILLPNQNPIQHDFKLKSGFSSKLVCNISSHELTEYLSVNVSFSASCIPENKSHQVTKQSVHKSTTCLKSAKKNKLYWSVVCE